jgi:predicted GNAT superfamily acetyltransferase
LTALGVVIVWYIILSFIQFYNKPAGGRMERKEVAIAPLWSTAQYQICEDLQAVIWQADPVEVVPAHLLITAQRHGGLVLGAFAPGGEMVGCLFGFPARTAADNPLTADPEWEHCSHFMGVVPEWRGRGVGYQLKLAQREWALSQGYGLITWTYDPLEAGNAVLNLTKLGAVCRCYLRDFYGEMAEGLNVGLPTDRFEVAWWLDSDRVHERVAGQARRPELEELLAAGAVVLNAGSVRPGSSVEPGALVEPVGERVLVEIPTNIQAVKAESMELALAWRLSVREACEAAFAAGYIAQDVVSTDERARVYYVLRVAR